MFRRAYSVILRSSAGAGPKVGSREWVQRTGSTADTRFAISDVADKKYPGIEEKNYKDPTKHGTIAFGGVDTDFDPQPIKPGTEDLPATGTLEYMARRKKHPGQPLRSQKIATGPAGSPRRRAAHPT